MNSGDTYTFSGMNIKNLSHLPRVVPLDTIFRFDTALTLVFQSAQ